MHRSLASLLPRLPAAAAPALASALEAVQGTAIEVVAPIFKTVMEGVEERILKVCVQSILCMGCQLLTCDMQGIGSCCAVMSFMTSIAGITACGWPARWYGESLA